MKRILLVFLVALAIMLTAFAFGNSVAAKAPRPHRPTANAAILRPGLILHAPTLPHLRRISWLRCNRAGRRCLYIRGAHGRTYRVTKLDIGHTIRAALTTSAANGQTTVITGPTPVIAPPTPVNLTLPTISGVAAQGQALTVDPGTWQYAVRYTYQWEDCDTSGNNCVAIAGATGTTYVLQASDVGSTIRVAVTAYNTGPGVRADSAIS